MKSNKYEMFRLMPNNRSINNALVKSLVKSIQEIGYIDARPIIVDNSFTIIDGQHRFEACKQLGLPIIYDISEADAHKTMIALNSSQKIWSMANYVESWANAGLECYAHVVEFENKYKLGMSNAITICITGRGNNALWIKQGREFTPNPNGETIALFLLQCKLWIGFYKAHKFVTAVTALFAKTTPSNCRKILDNIPSLSEQPNHAAYVRCFENILNKNIRKADNRVSLL